MTLDALRVFCAVLSGELEQRATLLDSVSQLSGPQALLTRVLSVQPADTPERFERLLARLAGYPAYVAGHIANAREGIRAGLVQPRIVTERTIGQLERLVAAPPEASPVVTAPQGLEPSERERLVRAAREQVAPALVAFLEALRSEYLPAARAEPGLGALPDGEARYAAAIRTWTTLELAPRALHELGREELAALDAERLTIVQAAGGGEVAAYRRALAGDQENVPRTAEALLGRMREDVQRALEAAPAVFGRLPATPCEIRPLDAFQAADSLGYYLEPSPEQGRPGAFYMNTTNLRDRHFSRYATVTYHETIPGHHLQLATATELPDRSRFRRHGADRISGAYIEGWGLYAERLADELGLFRGSGERFGMLDAQAWRAARLVVDTGLHALGWSRERAIDVLVEAVGFTRTDAAIEVDRYIAMPGQALSYTVGRRELERLRRDAAATRGARFDLRRFHDEVLGHGSLPLATLARQLPGWLAA